MNGKRTKKVQNETTTQMADASKVTQIKHKSFLSVCFLLIRFILWLRFEFFLLSRHICAARSSIENKRFRCQSYQVSI